MDGDLAANVDFFQDKVCQKLVLYMDCVKTAGLQLNSLLDLEKQVPVATWAKEIANSTFTFREAVKSIF